MDNRLYLPKITPEMIEVDFSDDELRARLVKPPARMCACNWVVEGWWERNTWMDRLYLESECEKHKAERLARVPVSAGGGT